MPLGASSPSVVFHGVYLDASPSIYDGLISTEVDIGRREVAEALALLVDCVQSTARQGVSVVVVVVDEGLDLPFQIFGQEVVLQRHPVLTRQVMRASPRGPDHAFFERTVLQAQLRHQLLQALCLAA